MCFRSNHEIIALKSVNDKQKSTGGVKMIFLFETLFYAFQLLICSCWPVLLIVGLLWLIAKLIKISKRG